MKNTTHCMISNTYKPNLPGVGCPKLRTSSIIAIFFVTIKMGKTHDFSRKCWFSFSRGFRNELELYIDNSTTDIQTILNGFQTTCTFLMSVTAAGESGKTLSTTTTSSYFSSIKSSLKLSPIDCAVLLTIFTSYTTQTFFLSSSYSSQRNLSKIKLNTFKSVLKKNYI